MHSIHQKDCKDVAEFISKIRDISAEITDLNITMDEAITIHALNSLDTHFKSYLAILSHDSREKEHLPTLEVLAKALEDEELLLANQDRATANYSKREKKSGGDSGNKKKAGKNSNSSTSTDKETSKCTKCQCWMDKMTCNGCGKIGHIKKFCKKNKINQESETTTPEVTTSALSCFNTKITPTPTNEVEERKGMGAVHLICKTGATVDPVINPRVIIDSGATDHFFSNRDFFSTYTEYYHEFQTDPGQVLPAFGYGDVVLNMVQQDKNINVLTVKNISWALDLGHNLLSTILLAIEGDEVFLRKIGVATQILHEGKLHGLADVIDRQYVLRIKTSEVTMHTNFANTTPIVNAIKPTIEIWH